MTAAIAVVLGAGGGIGSACCLAFAGAGYRVVAGDIRVSAAEAAVRGLPREPIAAAVDVTRADEVDRFTQGLAADGRIAALVYAPGLVMTAAIERTDWARYRDLMAVNLDGAFHAAAAFARVMKQGGPPAAMVLIASTAGRRGEAGASHYCASKFGLIGLGESLAAELAPDGIRVNVVCPGNVDTPMLREVARQVAAFRGLDEEGVWRSLHETGAARRLVRPEEVAAACVALCEPAFSGTTGATLTVDAGASVG